MWGTQSPGIRPSYLGTFCAQDRFFFKARRINEYLSVLSVAATQVLSQY